MQFYNPTVTFKGAVKCDNAPVDGNDLARKQDIASNSYITSIAANSQNMLSVSGGALSLDSLAFTDVHVDDTQTTLANFVSNESATAASLKEGDVLVLTAPADGTEMFMVSGANGSSVSNYVQIESPVTAAEVGSVLSAGNGITVNAATAQISANLAAGSGLSSSVSGGQITFAFSGNSDIVAEGSSNLYYTQARCRTSIQADPAAGNLLSYANASGDMLVSTASVRGAFSAGTGLGLSAGQFSFTGNSDIVGEGSSNLYYTDARARGALSAGTGITYNNASGAFALALVGGTAIGVSGATISFNGSTSDVSEGTNKYFTEARARQAIQADPAAGNLLSYANASGDMLVSTTSVRGAFSAGTGLGLSAGQFSFTGNSDIVAEGSSNKYFTDARSRQAIQADPAAGNLLSYANASGDMLVSTASVRGAFSAGTALSYSGGQFAFNGSTNDVSEGANLYYTDARVRAAISVSSNADELISYNAGNGQFSLQAVDIRHESTVTLSANTGLQITHNLGKKLVQFAAMDASGNKIDLQVVYNTTSALTVTSAVGITVTIAISL